MNYPTYEPKRLYRSDDSVLFGVCGGLAEYFDLRPFAVRLIWVMLIFTPLAPFLLISYVVLGLVLKRRSSVLPPPLPGADPYAFGSARLNHGEMLTRIQQRFETLDRRLQRMESIVTRPGFDLEEKYREL